MIVPVVRRQIQLELAQHRAVRRRARRLGVSVSEVIRRCVDAELRDDQYAPGSKVRKALGVVGKYSDARGTSRVAADHDAPLADAFKE